MRDFYFGESEGRDKLISILKEQGFYDFFIEHQLIDKDDRKRRARVDLVAKDKNGLNYAFELKVFSEKVKMSMNYSRRLLYRAMEQISYYRTLQEFDRWVIVFLGGSSYIHYNHIINDVSVLNSMGISVWQLRGNTVSRIFESDSQLKSSQPLDDYKLIRSEETKEIFEYIKDEKEQKQLADAFKAVEEAGKKEGKEEGITETRAQFRRKFRTMLYEDILGGGGFAGGFFVLIDGSIQTVIDSSNWYIIVIGFGVMVLSLLPWYIRFRKTKKKKKCFLSKLFKPKG